jgi:hypothetical protein
MHVRFPEKGVGFMGFWKRWFGTGGNGGLRCSFCRRTSSISGMSGKIVLTEPAVFLKMVGRCQACGILVCGSCARKEDVGIIVRYKCPTCRGIIGPA